MTRGETLLTPGGERDVVGLLGGLGNQLFQYSFGLSLRKSGRSVSFDASALRSGGRKLELSALVARDLLPQERWLRFAPYPRGRFGKSGEFIRILRRPRRIVFEMDSGLPVFPIEETPSWWYGYWQSPEMVRSVLPELRRTMAAIMPQIVPATVGIHVRRGDYVGNDLLLSPEYYRGALNELFAKHELDPVKTRVVVFSDDPEWCESSLSFDVPVDFSPPRDTKEDFAALLASEYLVLSRSTFSWWAGVLPARPERNVISPFPYTPYPEAVLDYSGWLRHPVS